MLKRPKRRSRCCGGGIVTGGAGSDRSLNEESVGKGVGSGMEITMNEKTDRQGVESGIEIGKWNLRCLIFYCFLRKRRAGRAARMVDQ